MEIESGNGTSNYTAEVSGSDRFMFVLYRMAVPTLFGVVTVSGQPGFECFDAVSVASACKNSNFSKSREGFYGKT